MAEAAALTVALAVLVIGALAWSRRLPSEKMRPPLPGTLCGIGEERLYQPKWIRKRGSAVRMCSEDPLCVAVENKPGAPPTPYTLTALSNTIHYTPSTPGAAELYVKASCSVRAVKGGVQSQLKVGVRPPPSLLLGKYVRRPDR